MDVHEVTNRWNDLLLQTRVLWESCRNLRQEAVSAVEVSGGTFATLGGQGLRRGLPGGLHL